VRGLADKVVVVAGGGAGLGAAAALRLGAEGAAVVVGDIFVDKAQAVAEQIVAAGGRAVSSAFDVTDEASTYALAAAAVETYGGLDGMLFGAADMSLISKDGDALAISLDVFDRVIQAHLRGQLLCTRAALPHLLARGGGALVFMSSVAAFEPEPRLAAYSAAKAGINALMRHVATTWGKQGVRANALAPGLVVTERMAAIRTEESLRSVLAGTPSPRNGAPDDIAGAAAFLISDDGAWINGQVINVDGGRTMR
jgi:NAD(P)-dependent dehydrogenase (short-subunit alcohol dehydrogenase family)